MLYKLFYSNFILYICKLLEHLPSHVSLRFSSLSDSIWEEKGKNKQTDRKLITNSTFQFQRFIILFNNSSQQDLIIRVTAKFLSV